MFGRLTNERNTILQGKQGLLIQLRMNLFMNMRNMFKIIFNDKSISFKGVVFKMCLNCDK